MWARVTTCVLLSAAAAGCAAEGPLTSKLPRYHKKVQSDLERAIAQAAEGRYGEAAAEFQRLFGTFREAGDRPHAAEALFWLGFCREKQGSIDKARQLYRQVEQEYPDTPAADQTRPRLQMLSPPRGTGP